MLIESPLFGNHNCPKLSRVQSFLEAHFKLNQHSSQLKQRLPWHFADSFSVEPSCIFFNMVACASCLGGAQFCLKRKQGWERRKKIQREYNYAGNGQNKTTIDFFAFGKSKSKLILLSAESLWWHWWLNPTVHNLIKMKMELPFLATF